MEPSFRDILDPVRVATKLVGTTKESVLTEVARLLATGAPALDADTVRRVLLERERLASTGVGSGVAIPHGRIRGFSGVRIALAIHPEGVHFDAIDGGPVHIFIGVIASDQEASLHLKVLARASRLLRDAQARERFRAHTDPKALFDAFVMEDERRST